MANMQLSIKTKLVTLTGFFVMIIVGVAFMSWRTSTQLGDLLNLISDQDYPIIRAALKLEVTRTGQADDLGSYLASQEERFLEEFRKGQEVFEEWQAAFEKLNITEDARKIMEEIDRLDTTYDQKADEVITSVKAGNLAEANRLSNDVLGPLEDQIFERLISIEEMYENFVGQTGKDADAAIALAAQLEWIVPLIGVIIGGVFAFFIVRGILKQLGAEPDVVAQIAKTVAEGDLNIQIGQPGKVPRGLLASMQTMVVKLREVVSDVQGAAENVSSGSEAMSSGAEEMSNGATEQASATEEASTSMEQMTANIRQNADNATQTEKIAIKAADDAQKSGQAVAETVTAMREIVRKITIIEEIARQTHTLSLNATIEAAKAQEYGKGFAVVAAEVRALASRAQDASAEINQMASQSIDIAERAGDMLSKLVPDIERTAELVQEIGAASREQSSGTGQINRAIQQLDQVTQQNSAISEETASTAEELAGQAEQLQHTIAFFRVGETGRQRQTANVHAPLKKLSVVHLKDRAKPQPTGNSSSKVPIVPVEFIDTRDREHEGDPLDAEFERY